MLLTLFSSLYTAIGFGLALVLFAGLREQMSLVKVPKGMQGTPIALITAGPVSYTHLDVYKRQD